MPSALLNTAAELPDNPIHLVLGGRMNHDGQREVPQGLSVAKLPQAVPQVVDVGLLRVIPQDIARIDLTRDHGRSGR